MVKYYKNEQGMMSKIIYNTIEQLQKILFVFHKDDKLIEIEAQEFDTEER